MSILKGIAIDHSKRLIRRHHRLDPESYVSREIKPLELRLTGALWIHLP